MALTPEAKKLLAETIRGTQQSPEKGLRARLLRAVHDEAERRYHLSVSVANAGLDEAHRRRRERLEAWIDERARAAKPKNKVELQAVKQRLLEQAEKEAAATLVNRLVLLRQLEAVGLSKPPVLIGGWESKGYREFREFAPTLCRNGTTDATEGYATLLDLLFGELAVDLPGLFGDVGLTRLFPVPAATLREVVERLDDPDLAPAWTDDTTLGWVYQYWNDPDREALDAKINSGGKIEPHEIASKTQMFTERYMVEWLLQNSLGLTWLCMCKKHGWKADAERVLPALEARRVEWRKRREAGEVELDALMPIEGELEDHWKYFVPQLLPDEAIAKAPESVRTLKILDPACGSGHFLVIAFDLLAALYREEARHRDETISDREIAESVLENNLHGIDIDPRATQIAAAGLYLKAKTLAKDARPKKLNVVAPALQLGNLPADDPAVAHLRQDLKREVGIPEELTNKLLTSLAGVDHLGSLLKVDAAVEDALRSVELEFARTHGQGDLFGGFPAQQVKLSIEEAKTTILDRLERFLAAHSRSEDLGLRLDGEQLAAGVRFARIAKENTYDVVVGNPPYQGMTKTNMFGLVAAIYPKGKADLYAAFLERGLELARPGGVSSMVTIRGWMFLSQFKDLRKQVLHAASFCFGDLGWGAFEQMTDNPVTMAVARKLGRSGRSLALAPTDPSARIRTDEHRRSLEAGLLVQVGRHEFDPRGFEAIEGEPIVYWWTDTFLENYRRSPKVGDVAPIRQGMASANNAWFLRRPWELPRARVSVRANFASSERQNWVADDPEWLPFIKGAAGRVWFEPLSDAVRWASNGLALKVSTEHWYGSATRNIKNESWYLRQGVAFSTIGSDFSARAHRFPSVIGDTGASLFPQDVAGSLCSLNSSRARDFLQSINPSVHFVIADVARLPISTISCADSIVATLDAAFSGHEAGREPSFEFKSPRSSTWRGTQLWAQAAVDRQGNDALPAYQEALDPPTPASILSFAVGVALGRFGAAGEGVLERAPGNALPQGILFLSCEGASSLDQPACALVLEEWKKVKATLGTSSGADLSAYLRKDFFDFHKKLYENRPIYFPLSSAKKSFVAFLSIHRFVERWSDAGTWGDDGAWGDTALQALLADHLVPTKRRLEGELDDLRTARASGANKGKAEKRFSDVQKLLEELNDFIAKVTEVAEHGPPPPDDKTTKREVDARYTMDLDDGVMVNSAALWPLLEPQWKDPKKWWKELANAQGKKDYDWSHLAARYFPTRVREKCHDDPSLAVAHKCFWELHPAKAYAWELRLQDEIRPDFTIDEPGSNEARAHFLAEHAVDAGEIAANEKKRRERKAAKAEDEGDGPLFGEEADDGESADA